MKEWPFLIACFCDTYLFSDLLVVILARAFAYVFMDYVYLFRLHYAVAFIA